MRRGLVRRELGGLDHYLFATVSDYNIDNHGSHITSFSDYLFYVPRHITCMHVISCLEKNNMNK